MMFQHSVIFLILLLLSCSTKVVSSSAMTKSWTLSHSNGVDPPTRRGTIRLAVNENDDTVELKIDEDQDSSSMEKLTKGKFYQLILKEEKAKDAVEIKATVLGCQLLRSNLRDQLVLTFGRQGTVLSMSYTPLVSALAPPNCDGDDMALSPEAKFQTQIDFEMDRPGMKLSTVLPNLKPPPGLVFLPGGQKARSAGGGGGFQDQQQAPPEQPTSLFGYLTKYWYVVAPLLLMNLLTEPPPKEGESGGQQQQQQQAAPAPAVAAAPAPSGKTRRGKRG